MSVMDRIETGMLAIDLQTVGMRPDAARTAAEQVYRVVRALRAAGWMTRITAVHELHAHQWSIGLLAGDCGPRGVRCVLNRWGDVLSICAVRTESHPRVWSSIEDAITPVLAALTTAPVPR